jgi:AcrR family transcriptional regulator
VSKFVEERSGLRERHKARRRAQILDAARALLREGPEEAVTTERIARRAEVVPATVYNLVGPRDALWEALAEAFVERLERRLAEEDEGDPVRRARRVVELTVELPTSDPDVSRAMLRGWPDSGAWLRPGPVRGVRDALEEARARGVLRADADPDALAAVVGATLVGALHQWAAGVIDAGVCRDRALRSLDLALRASATAEPGA